MDRDLPPGLRRSLWNRAPSGLDAATRRDGNDERGAIALNRQGPMATNRHYEPRQRAVVTTMRRVNDVG